MTKLLKTSLADEKTRGYDLVLVGCFRREDPPITRLPRPLANAAKRAAGRGGWRGERDQATTVPVSGKHEATVTLRGLGRRGELEPRHLRKWLAKAVKTAAAEGFREPLLVLPSHPLTAGSEGAYFVLSELGLSGYRFDAFVARDKTPRLRSVRLLPPPGEDDAFRDGWRLARKVALAVERTRDLANTPPNVATPEWMADQARQLAEDRGMEVEVLGPEELEKRGMGGLLAVGGGSANPPRLVRLEWGEGERAVSLVGKGVTFDTGGISIKPSANMDEMKFDKSGACTVFGIAQGAADLELPFRFRVYLPLAENMPDGRAYRPGDIVRSYNGKTVEILNTDAEGRMILADALAWAAEEKPDDLLDFATLTGACVVALGQKGAGLYSHDDSLAGELLEAAGSTHDYLWRMPLWPEFGEQMRGSHGDLKNIGVRWGGANSAAAFLSNFVEGAGRWAHIDIAGPAYVERSDNESFGATGYGVALTLAWLRRSAGLD